MNRISPLRSVAPFRRAPTGRGRLCRACAVRAPGPDVSLPGARIARSGCVVLALLLGLGLGGFRPLLLEAQVGSRAVGQGQADPATEARALAILERSAERYGSMQAFCADFRQEVQNDILRQTTRSRGELCQRRPDRFEMRFTDPQGDRVVADGTHLWAYFPSTDPGQAFRTGAAEAGGRFDLHREFLADPGTRYRPLLQGEETIEGERTFVLALTPLGDSPFVRARLWVEARGSLLRRIEITETEGFVRTLELGTHRVDPVLPDSRFRFEPPSGVRVVGP